jgi:hypothetical protein
MSAGIALWTQGIASSDTVTPPRKYKLAPDQKRLCRKKLMVWYAVMATMTHRTTFALDQATVEKLRKLSRRWKVSLAEAVRRAVAQAESQDEQRKPNPIEMLQQLHDSGQSLDPQKAKAYLAKVYEDRKHWRKE